MVDGRTLALQFCLKSSLKLKVGPASAVPTTQIVADIGKFVNNH